MGRGSARCPWEEEEEDRQAIVQPSPCVSVRTIIAIFEKFTQMLAVYVQPAENNSFHICHNVDQLFDSGGPTAGGTRRGGLRGTRLGRRNFWLPRG